MSDCKPCSTPADTSAKLSATDGSPVADPTDYRSLAGALQYLTFTRPDISYAVQQVCLHMHDPREPHLAALKQILRYIRGTITHGLRIQRSAPVELIAYSDADWAGCPDTRRSTSGYAVFLGDNLVSWSSKRQVAVSPRHVGFVNSFMSCINLPVELHLFTVTMSAPSISPPTRFNINAPSMSRLTSTLFATGWLRVRFMFFTFPRRLNTLTSSPRGFPHRCSRSFVPVSTFGRPTLQLRRGGGGGC